MESSMKNFKVIAILAMGLIAGAGLVFLIIRYMDKLTEIFDSVKKRVILKLEFCRPRSVRLTEAFADGCCQAFKADCAAEPGPTGDPIPNIPTEE